jgi:hypothetical protein
MLRSPTFEDEDSLYSLAAEYLHSAEILASAPVTKLNVSLVTFFLLGHAAELLLKSHLYKAGTSLTELKMQLGHNLAELEKRAQAVGFHPPLELPYVRQLSTNYGAKFTEYRQLKAMTFPPQDLLLAEVMALQARVFNRIAELPR